MARRRGRPKNQDNNRRSKKRVSILTSEKIRYVDWKDSDLLRKFMSERAKIRARQVTGNSAQQQKLVADAIKLAREMALVPYANRVTTQRQSKERSASRRPDGPAPRPAAPPPGQGSDGPDSGRAGMAARGARTAGGAAIARSARRPADTGRADSSGAS